MASRATATCRNSPALVVEAVPEPNRHLSGTVEVRTTERIAFIEQKMRVTDVQGGHHQRPLLAEGLAALDVEGRMRRLVSRAVCFEKSGTEPDRAGRSRAGRQFDLHTRRERVALVVIEEELVVARRLE
jgi:hypothetical protein